MVRLKEKIKDEFKAQINKYWKKEIKKINSKKQWNFFFKMKKIFRQKKRDSITTLKVMEENRNLLLKADIDTNQIKNPKVITSSTNIRTK